MHISQAIAVCQATKQGKAVVQVAEFVLGASLASHLGTTTSWHLGTQNLSLPQFRSMTADHVKIPELAAKQLVGAATSSHHRRTGFTH